MYIIQKREFHANPLPDLINPPNLPQKPPVMTTKIEPFKLQTDERVQHHLEKFNEQVNDIIIILYCT